MEKMDDSLSGERGFDHSERFFDIHIVNPLPMLSLYRYDCEEAIISNTLLR
jgi:hypothetical protein